MLYGLEDEGLLDPNSESYVFALHYVFIPRIQRQLDIFREAYSHHRLRGQCNRSPYQLWIQGMAHLDSDDNAQNGTVDDDSFGIDWNGPVVAQVQEEHVVTVPNTSCPLNEESLEQLKTLVNPLVDCDDHGVILYIAAKEFVQGDCFKKIIFFN